VKEFVQCLGPSDPAELDGDERTMIYRRLLKQSDSPTGWAKRLRYFDFFVHTEFDIDPADWRSLAPELPALGGSVYDYLTLADINRLDTIASTLDAGDRLDSATATSLRFLSRSGMRSGEAYRLAVTDLAPAPLAYLRVENKASGEVKTRSGIRHASVFSLPTVRDVDPVSVAKAFSEESATLGDGSLFSSTKASLGISRSNLLHRMKSSICLATGHSRSRPHHGRHSIVSHGVLLAVDLPHPLVLKALGGISADEYERAHAALRLQLTGRRGTTMLWRIAFPQTVGHKEFATSVEHYLHVVDILLAAETDTRGGRRLFHGLSASLLGISANTPSTRPSRSRETARRYRSRRSTTLLLARRSKPAAAPRSQLQFPSLDRHRAEVCVASGGAPLREAIASTTRGHWLVRPSLGASEARPGGPLRLQRNTR
jgi:integrase